MLCSYSFTPPTQLPWLAYKSGEAAQLTDEQVAELERMNQEFGPSWSERPCWLAALLASTMLLNYRQIHTFAGSYSVSSRVLSENLLTYSFTQIAPVVLFLPGSRRKMVEFDVALEILRDYVHMYGRIPVK